MLRCITAKQAGAQLRIVGGNIIACLNMSGDDGISWTPVRLIYTGASTETATVTWSDGVFSTNQLTRDRTGLLVSSLCAIVSAASLLTLLGFSYNVKTYFDTRLLDEAISGMGGQVQ